MRSAEEVAEAIRASKPAERVINFAALLSSEAGFQAGDLIVVGGSAVEVYTQPNYVSGDIDIVTERDRALRVLRRWGFRFGHRNVWHNGDWGIVVDLVKSNVAEYTGSRERTRLIESPYGTVRIEAIEDSMIRRLIQARVWHRPSELEFAFLMASLHSEAIDWDYAERIAKVDLVFDLLTEIRARLGR
jgi:hypothetical protein